MIFINDYLEKFFFNLIFEIFKFAFLKFAFQIF